MAGSSAGWALGAPLGPFAAYLISTCGFGVGMYAGRKLAEHLGG